MNLHLDKKIIVVTDGAKGIGEGIVKALAAENAVPVIVGKNETDNLKTLESIDNKGFQVVCELTKPEECEQAIQKIVEKYNRIDGLINNSEVNDGVGLAHGNYKDFIASLHKNLVHYYLMAHYALPYLKQSKGTIINIGFKSAETGQGNASSYAASNGGRNALTRDWAVELLKYRIRVNTVIVAECNTSMHQNGIKTFENPEEKLKSFTEKIPSEKQLTTPEEIATIIVFLLSERSSHTTGQIIHVDGGYVHPDRAI